MQEAKKYEQLRILLGIAGFIVEVSFLLVAYFSGLSGVWQRFVEAMLPWRSAQIALFILILFGVSEILDFPLNFWRNWLLPRRFALSHQPLAGWLKDYLTMLFLGFILLIILFEFFYLFLALSPQKWWLWCSLFLIFFLIVLARLTPVLLLPLFIKATPLQDEELTYRLQSLSQQLFGIRLPIYEMNLSDKTRGATAMLAGLGRTRRIYLADTLLRQFPPDEIYTVTAHEFAHHFYHHIWKGIALQIGIVLIAMALLKFFVSTVFPGVDLQELANMPLITLLIGAIFMMFMLPLNSILRRWELQADNFAVRITRLRSAFISALQRLAQLNLANPEPSPLIETLFYTHPPIKKRIAALKKSAV